MALTRDQLILTWRQAQADLRAATDKERELRDLVLKTCFPTKANDPGAEGTANFDLGQGYALKAVFRQTYKLENYDVVSDVLSRIRRIGTQDALDAYRNLVTYRPELKVGAYKKLPASIKMMIDGVLSVKPGLPSLELVEPKSEGQ